MLMQKQGQLRNAQAFRGCPAKSRCVKAQAFKLPKWDVVYDYLTKTRGLRTVAPEEAQELVESGKYVLVDVRTGPAYETSHPQGAVNVPMYQPLDWSKPDVAKVIKFVAYSFNGVSPVEPNPEFIEKMKEATNGGSRGVITLCEAGGTLKPSTNFPFGKASRSLQAAYRCYVEGVTSDVLHLDRGVYGWYQADLPFEGKEQYKPDIGRSPMAAAEPTIEAIRASTGYAIRPEDKK